MARKDADVVVVGAGAAGLAAARDLSGNGLTVVLLEARDRIGGRIHTLHPPDLATSIELGAEFIHGEAPEAFEIVDAAALLAIELPDTHWWSGADRWKSVPDFWQRVENVRRKLRPLRRDVSFDTFLQRRRDVASFDRSLVRSFVEGYHAADAARISALSLSSSDAEQESARANRQFRIFSGYDAVPRWLASGLAPDRTTVQLSTAVTAIAWEKGGVSVTTRRTESGGEERVRARCAVLTLPIGVWRAPAGQEGHIEFDPPLRAREDALSAIEAGHVVKVILCFDSPFWAEGELRRRRGVPDLSPPVNFVHCSGPVPTWWTTAPGHAPLVTAWAGGPAADALMAAGRTAMIDRILDAFAATFGVSPTLTRRRFVRSYSHDWQDDPWSRCAYSWATVGGTDAHDQLAKPLAGTLFFAGEATTSKATGTVSGAIATGHRAAREVLRALR